MFQEPKKWKKTDAMLKRPSGMNREVYALLYSDNKDSRSSSLIATDTGCGYRQPKARLGRKHVRPWKWMPFTNPARTVGRPWCSSLLWFLNPHSPLPTYNPSSPTSLPSSLHTSMPPSLLGWSGDEPLAKSSWRRKRVPLQPLQQASWHSHIHERGIHCMYK